MILFISYGGQRLAVTVQPARKASGQLSAASFDETSDHAWVLLLSHSLGKALSKTFGVRA